MLRPFQDLVIREKVACVPAIYEAEEFYDGFTGADTGTFKTCEDVYFIVEK